MIYEVVSITVVSGRVRDRQLWDLCLLSHLKLLLVLELLCGWEATDSRDAVWTTLRWTACQDKPSVLEEREQLSIFKMTFKPSRTQPKFTEAMKNQKSATFSETKPVVAILKTIQTYVLSNKCALKVINKKLYVYPLLYLGCWCPPRIGLEPKPHKYCNTEHWIQ